MASAANNQENDGGVKVLSENVKINNKIEKVFTEAEICSKTNELFGELDTILSG